MSQSEEVPRLEAELLKQLGAFYSDLTFLNSGGTSHVWSLVRNGLNDKRVLKLLKPGTVELVGRALDGTEIKRSLADYFSREIHHILRVKNEHVIRLYDAGALETADFGALPWYIMEYLHSPADLDKYLVKARASGVLTEKLLIQVITDVVVGLAACHTQGLAHADIKPANIQVSKDGDVVVTDFGFAKSLAELSESTDGSNTLWVGDERFMPDELLELLRKQRAQGNYSSNDPNVTFVVLPKELAREKALSFDLISLGKTLSFILYDLKFEKSLGQHWAFFSLFCERLLNAGKVAENGYQTIADAYLDLKKLQEGFSLNGVFAEFDPYPIKGILVPVVGRVAKTERFTRLLDLPFFQRLRLVRQLGLTHLVYPGATHTRFEHSIGVYARVIQYVKVLWTSRDYPFFQQSATIEDINALLVAALLHDIGHYPMSHAFEEVETRVAREFKHDVISQDMLSGRRPELLAEGDLEKLETQLRRDWGISVGDVLAVMSGARNLAKVISKNLVPLLHSILDGPLDADKLDYLQRDSLHCGYASGDAFGEERFLRSIIAPNGSSALAIRERGVPATEALFLFRHKMFLTVYWNRNNRAAERMVSEAIRLIRAQTGNFSAEFLRKAFDLDDEGMLLYIRALLNDERRAKQLIDPLLSSGRCRDKTYVRRLTIVSGKLSHPTGVPNPILHERITTFFQDYLSVNTAFLKYAYFEIAVRKAVLALLGKGFQGHEVLLDVPDPRVAATTGEDAHLLGAFSVFTHPGSQIDVSQHGGWFKTLLDDWKVDARKIRLMLSPEAAAQLSDVTTKHFERIVEDAAAAAASLSESASIPAAAIGDAWREVDEWGR